MTVSEWVNIRIDQGRYQNIYILGGALFLTFWAILPIVADKYKPQYYSVSPILVIDFRQRAYILSKPNLDSNQIHKNNLITNLS